jgi:hypothetical protein
MKNNFHSILPVPVSQRCDKCGSATTLAKCTWCDDDCPISDRGKHYCYNEEGWYCERCNRTGYPNGEAIDGPPPPEEEKW